ncbi:MAG: hypothetical protein AAFN11_19355, partial [Chloroflexota bacterium]
AALLTGEYSINQYAQPDYIMYGQIPRSGRSNKIDRLALRVQARAQLGIRDSVSTVGAIL